MQIGWILVLPDTRDPVLPPTEQGWCLLVLPISVSLSLPAAHHACLLESASKHDLNALRCPWLVYTVGFLLPIPHQSEERNQSSFSLVLVNVFMELSSAFGNILILHE